ncbi:MAG: pantetheine-phosphate adenylyltransferase, partial [Clostridia bacterium]|nr:pantetheine-phosphate adenylyltransferase [Clostridia bacterium]
VVAVMHNPDKRGAFAVEKRVDLLEKACAHIQNVRVIAHGGLLVDCAREQGVSCVVRGVRPLGDFESEYQMAQVNRMLGGVETLMMPTTESLASVSSSIVRQIAAFGGNIDNLVPACIAKEVCDMLAQKRG